MALSTVSELRGVGAGTRAMRSMAWGANIVKGKKVNRRVRRWETVHNLEIVRWMRVPVEVSNSAILKLR